MNKPLKYGLFLVSTIAIIQIVTVFVFEILTKEIAFNSSLKIFLLILTSLISSTIATVVIINTVPYFKKFLLEHRSQIRFQNLSHPLLLKLSIEAPGTYHHSLNVANLAYKAAQAINADALLCRTGAYYHDIGKLTDPMIFIENQKKQEKNDENSIIELRKHAKKILSHTKKGLEIAKSYSLPSKITCFIAEHHGTTSPIYFIAKIKKINSKANIKELIYPGPKPLSKETAIVMLADAIEANLRLVKNIDNNQIKEIVSRIITERINQKQLELSGLTKNELEIIKNTFIETLKTMHHQRINYKK